MSECERKNAWWRGCRFEPRFDVGPADGSLKATGHGPSMIKMFEMTKSKTYVRDVCIRCGKTIERTK